METDRPVPDPRVRGTVFTNWGPDLDPPCPTSHTVELTFFGTPSWGRGAGRWGVGGSSGV